MEVDGRNLLMSQLLRRSLRKPNQLCGINSIHDYYGMVEQTGSIFMECEYGNMHASNLSDIFIRRPHDFSIADVGERGIIQILSILLQVIQVIHYLQKMKEFFGRG